MSYLNDGPSEVIYRSSSPCQSWIFCGLHRSHDYRKEKPFGQGLKMVIDRQGSLAMKLGVQSVPIGDWSKINLYPWNRACIGDGFSHVIYCIVISGSFWPKYFMQRINTPNSTVLQIIRTNNFTSCVIFFRAPRGREKSRAMSKISTDHL